MLNHLTTHITLEEAWEEYQRNADFRAVIHTGQVYFKDNMFVYTPENQQQDEPIALQFQIKPVLDLSGGATRGSSANNKPKRKKVYDTSSKVELSENLQKRLELQKQLDELQKKSLDNHWQAMGRLLGVSEETTGAEFCERTGYPPETLSYLRRGYDKWPKVHKLVSLGAAYDCSLIEIEALLKVGGLAFSPYDKNHRAYMFVLGSLADATFDEKSTALSNLGFNPLGPAAHVAS